MPRVSLGQSTSLRLGFVKYSYSEVLESMEVSKRLRMVVVSDYSVILETLN